MLKPPFRAPSGGGAAGVPNPAAARPTRFASVSRLSRTIRRRWPIALVLLLVVAGVGYVASGRLSQPPPAVAQRTAAVTRGTLVSTVSATGTVAALAQSRLAFGTSGRVVEVLVKQGDAVKKDAPLARLDVAELTLQLTQQKASLASAEAKLANMKAGSRTEEIRASQLQLDAAKAKLAAMEAGGRAEDVATARASLESARAKLNQLMSPNEADLKAAEQSVAAATSSLQTAQNNLDKLRNGATADEIRAAEFAIEQAKNSLWSQQISRDGTCGRDPDNYQCKSADAGLASAESSVTKAQVELEVLKAPAKAEDVLAAEKALASAQAQLEAANLKLQQLKSPTAADVAAAQSAVTQAEQSLALKVKPYTEADLQAQRQAVASAEASLVAKMAPYTDADLISAQASVEQAKVQVALAQRNLDNATLVAPFDGVVGAVGFNVGEASGSATITLVDPKNVRLDVTVDESDIAKVEAGQKANVTFDAIANRPFAGTVTGVAPVATVQSGVSIYSVSIALPKPGPVKPGMTGNANIVFGEKVDALIVPNRAVRTQGRDRVVDVVVGGLPEASPVAGSPAAKPGGTPGARPDGATGATGGNVAVLASTVPASAKLQIETRVVKVGLPNDQMTEITEGLNEGEVVLIPTTTSALQGGRGGAMAAPAGGPVMVTR